MTKYFYAVILVLGFASAAQAGEWYGEHEYLKCNPDVAQAVYRGEFDSGWHHFQVHGQYEDRITDGSCTPPRWWNEREYIRCHTDVRRAVRRGEFKSGWAHYNAFGRNENRALKCR